MTHGFPRLIRGEDRKIGVDVAARFQIEESMDTSLLLYLALLLDAVLGEPRFLWDRAPHPAISIWT